MKLEIFADILNKSATELSSALKLEEGLEEVPTEIVQKEIKTLINDLNLKTKSEKLAGIKEGEGKAQRLFKKSAEDKFKKLGVEGEDFDKMFENLESRLKKPPVEDDGFRDKYTNSLKTIQSLEAKIKETNDAIEAEKQRNELFATVKSKMPNSLDKFEFATDTVKQTAIKVFLESNKFQVMGNDVFIDIDGNPSAKFEDHLNAHLKQWGKLKDSKKPTNPIGGGSNYSDDLPGLTKQMQLATTPEEKALIKAKIKAKLVEAT